jgi:NlpC/P60 family putative phage cell wall peptidase
MMDRAVDAAEAERGREIVARARAWIGTPYEHQASCRGAGSDCLGLLRGLWREMHGSEPEVVPPYTPDWSEREGAEDLLAAAARHLEPIPVPSARDGDVAVMRMSRSGPAKHVGILARAPEGHRTLIHAFSGHGVVESPLTPAWAGRIAGVFRFPEGNQ